MSNEDSRQSPEVNHRSPLKPTGKEAELAAALKKSRRRSGSSPGNAGIVYDHSSISISIACTAQEILH